MVLDAMGLIAGAALLVFVTIFMRKVLSAARLRRRGIEVVGQVVGIEPKRPGSVFVRTAFRTREGRRIEYVGPSGPVKIGQDRIVHYDPHDPARATAHTTGTRAAVVLGGALAVALAGIGMAVGGAYGLAGGDSQVALRWIGVSFAALATAALLLAADGSYRDARRSHHLTSANGKVVRDDIINGASYFVISFPTSGGRHSELIAQARTVPAEPGDTITVYYDPEYPEWTATVTTRSYSRPLATVAAAGAVLVAAVTVSALWIR